MFLVSDHGVEDEQQFSHGGDEGDHLLFAGGDQALVVGSDFGVVSGGHEGGHVQRRADRGAAAVGGAFAPHGAGVSVDRGDPDQCGDLTTRALAQFRQLSHERSCGLIADAGHALEQVDLLLPSGGVFDRLIEVVVEVFELSIEEVQHGLDAGVDRRGEGLLKTVGFGGTHRHELSSSSDFFLQNKGIFVGQGPDVGLDGSRESGQEAGVEGVGFGQLADGACEVAGLSWVDHDDGQHGREHGRDGVSFVAAGGFEHDALGVDRLELMDQRGVSVRVVVESCDGAVGVGGDVEMGFGDVDPDADWVGCVHESILPCDAGLRLAEAHATVRIETHKTGRDLATIAASNSPGWDDLAADRVCPGFVRYAHSARTHPQQTVSNHASGKIQEVGEVLHLL